MPKFATFLVLGTLCACAGGLTPRAVPASTETGEVHFEFLRHQILLPVHIGEAGPFYMLLDTGANPSVVDLALARQLGLPVDTREAGQAGGIGNESVTVYRAEIENLDVGGVPVESVRALAMDLAPLSKAFGRPLHGILGQSFLRDRVVEIDYPSRNVRLLHADRVGVPQEAGESARLPLTPYSPTDLMPVVPVRVNGQDPIPVTLDTGSSLTLELFPSAVERLHLEGLRAQATQGTVAGARGQAEVSHAYADSVGLGPFVIPRPEITFGERDGDGQQRLGNLGNGFLQHFVITLDYPRREIRLRRP